MDSQGFITLVVAAGGVFAVVWLLQKIGKAIAAVLEALAALAMVFLALWLVVRTTWRLAAMAVRHWRTTIGFAAIVAWVMW